MRLFGKSIGWPGGAKALPDCLALGLTDMLELAPGPGGAVIRDENGVPVAWRLFPFGEISITQGNETARGEFTREAADTIVEYYAKKGSKIPLDSKHFLFHLAEKLGVGESEVLNLLPDGRGTFGYAALAKQDDGLWVVDVEYVPLAYRLMAEGIFRYWSPVLRGLSTGMLRITSVTFTNIPATDGLDSLAAEGEETPWHDIDTLAASLDAAVAASANRSSTSTKEQKHMKKLLALIAPLIGLDADSMALSGDNAVPEDVVGKLQALAGEVTSLRTARADQEAFLAGAKDALALSGDATLKTALAALVGLKASADQAKDLKTRVDALALEAETRKRGELEARGVHAGQLTKAFMGGAFYKGLDSVALSAYLETAPVVVPPGQVDRAALASVDSVALSDDQRAIFAQLGITDPKAQEAAAKL